MHKGTKKNGTECMVFDSYEEVCKEAFNPPKYCSKYGTALSFISFHDSLGRYTLQAGCRKCKDIFAISSTMENYHKHMLSRWTEMVKKRAGYKCEMADDKCSGELHAHHIIPRAADPAKQYDITNGMCLCARHHKMIHKFMED